MKRIKVLSLAALVAFAACDEGTEPIVAPPVTGTITGVVTIEGAARSGVSVALSSGATATTDASGAYSFAGVNAGTYTVTISGFPTDATFSSTTKGATITTAGQVATVNFDGVYVRTSAILGSVSAGGSGLPGVRVAITGANTPGANVNTDANGQYAFSGLRAGTYTVTISNFDAAQFTFSTTSSTVTVAVGATQSVSFTGQRLATATISGTVTIEGAPAAGVRATLSTGAVATTSATGAYSFGNLTTGTYTVTISGFAADAQFETVARTVTITSAGSTVNANFAGTYIRTATLTGFVTVAGAGVGGVTVSLSGAATATVNTGANGQYSFSALRAGTYTVTISGWNAGLYTFAATSDTVTLATGQSSVRNFAGAHVATAVISGSLFIDEMAANGTFETTTEDKLAVAGIVVQAEGGAVNQTITTTTNASGDYSFTGLTAGTYRISILGVTGAPLNPALPGNVAFRAAQPTSEIRTVAVGGTASVNWPFNITVQRVDARINLTTSLTAAASAPVTGVTIRLYDTYANALANGGTPATGMIGTGTSTANPGVVTFRFNRALDVGPGGPVDNVVFALAQTLPANHALLNSNVMEIKYSPKDSIQVSPDFFRAQNNQVVFRVRAQEIDDDLLSGWTAQMRFTVADTAHATNLVQANSAANGWVTFTLNRAAITALYPGKTFPDTLYTRLATALQPNVYPFVQTPTADRATAVSRFLRFVWNGTIPASDTVVLGAHKVRYTQASVRARAHRERDDSTGTTPLLSSGDDFSLINLVNIELREVKADGSTVVVAGPTAAGADGWVQFDNVLTDKNFQLRARSTDANLRVLNDTVQAFALTGADEIYTNRPLAGSAGNSTFAVKALNNRVNGTIQARDGTPAQGIKVRVLAGPGNIQGTKDTTVVTNAAGFYQTNLNLLEGPYTITVADSVTASGTVWAFLTRLTTTNITGTPANSVKPHNSGPVNNTDGRTAVRDVQGSGVALTANFLADRMDTQIRGMIVNDRDGDTNTVDPEEGLAGVSVQLYRTIIHADSLVTTATTDGSGAFAFTWLREGSYIVRPVAVSNAVILRGLTNGDTARVRTAAAYTPAGGAGPCLSGSAALGNPDGNIASLMQANPTPNCHGRIVGMTTGFGGVLPLPAWGYGTSTFNLAGLDQSQPHFTFLYNTGVATGTVTKTGNPVNGVVVSAVRCSTATGFTSPPTVPIGGGTCTPIGSAINFTTGSNGVFTFSGLLEGVWLVTVNPATAGLPDPVRQALFQILGNNDVETGNFAY